MSILTSGPVHFGKIPEDHWYQPNWINETLAQEERHKMEEDNVIYGGSVSFVSPPSLIPSVGLTSIYLGTAICAVSTLGYSLLALYPFHPPLMHVLCPVLLPPTTAPKLPVLLAH